MLKVKGLDINDHSDDFAEGRNFELRPSVDEKKSQKKRKCC
jgi:hypothetical protein